MLNLTQIFESWPIIAVFLVFVVILLCRLEELRNWLIKRRIKRDFSEFEKSLVQDNGSGKVSRFFSGETKLPSELTVHIPSATLENSFIESLSTSLNQGLQQKSLGHVIRHFSIGDSCGIDVWLDDFVSGVEFLREHLVLQNVPQQTLIEYEMGEFPIYD